MSAPRTEEFGRLLMIGFEEDRWSASLERFLSAVRPGGVLFTARNLRTLGEALELVARVARTLDAPALLALHEETGAADAPRNIFPSLPAPRAAAARGIDAVSRLGDLAGEGSRLLGLNTCLAPVLDLAPPGGPGATTHAFHSDPEEVARAGEAFVRGLARHSVLACGRHFPGLGGELVGEPGSQGALRVIGKSMAELWREDLVPYRALARRLPVIQLSPAAYKAYDFDLQRPAALSAGIIEGLLRVKVGYRGVALSSRLEGERGRESSCLGELAIETLRAGCDLVLVGPGARTAESVLDAVRKAAESARIPAVRLEEALARLRALRKGLPRPGGKPSARALDLHARERERLARQCRSEEMRVA